ncbi:MAG: lysozyme inhibitor LprI family protein [Bdellovibrionales bacterium]
MRLNRWSSFTAAIIVPIPILIPILILISVTFTLSPTAGANTVDEVYCDGFDGNMRVACYTDLRDQETKRLQDTLKVLLKVLPAEIAAEVRESQKQWEAYRDSDCEAQRKVQTGSGEDALDMICPAVKTKLRADELSQSLQVLRRVREEQREKAGRRAGG